MRAFLVSSFLLTTACGGDDTTKFQGGLGGADAGAGASTATGGGGGSGGSGGSGGGGAALAFDETLGGPCSTDADCTEGTTCLTADSDALAGGGPPRGMCVADCAVGGPEACQAIDVNSLCLTVDDLGTPNDTTDDEAFCVPGCLIGDATDLASKCQGRVDLACRAISQAQLPLGYCFPACRNDDDCPGRFCDLGTGLCADQARPGGGIGDACDSSNGCAGLCLGISPSFSFCSGLCSAGSGGCGEPISGTEPLDAACILPEVTNLGTIGDSGYCVQLCDCNDDCSNPGAVCEAFGAAAQSETGRQGFCFDANLGSGTLSTGLPCGGSTDAGTPSDAGSVLDAAPPTDAAAVVDASTTTDAAVVDAATD